MVPAAVVAQCLPAYMQAVTRAARLLPMNSPTVSVPPLPVDAGCRCCAARGGTWQARRAFVLAAAGTLVLPVAAQVEVGSASGMRRLVPAETLEDSAVQQYSQLLAQAKAKRALAPDNHPQLLKLRAIARQIIPYAAQWNSRAAQWRWEVNLIGSKQINAFCMPGGKIAFYTGILDQLKLTDDEIAMVMGHEMAHALREHARSRVAKSQATSIGLSLGAQLLGLGDLGNAAANLGTQLLTLKFSRSDETDADLVGLELAARAGYNPQAAVSLWRKMGEATGNGGIAFLSTHPSGPDRIRELEQNVPKVQGLYQASRRG
ncbi:Zn-dependent protease with chaperone function [Diaphorobacter nitroreducens]|uniref:Zn-dependent protease with chaperone function n=2 Tax=Comamonadaceae TaxID=80864 RepID=A0AAX1WW60_9BURK|nr:Zn-dependent protease with chaperone function [Diaphorobacter nitroreducens]